MGEQLFIGNNQYSGLSVEERFWQKVDKKTDNGCWLWIGGHSSNGYGSFTGNNHKPVKAHRFSWILYYGEIPDGLLVCHHCDVKFCVNPKHLFLGIDQDNSDDMMKKGRGVQLHGEQNGNAKYTKEFVLKIRRIYKEGNYSRYKIAKMFNISYATIKPLLNRRSWAWLQDE
jgi:hypothetical protein